jgi:hypothetical protein
MADNKPGGEYTSSKNQGKETEGEDTEGDFYSSKFNCS